MLSLKETQLCSLGPFSLPKSLAHTVVSLVPKFLWLLWGVQEDLGSQVTPGFVPRGPKAVCGDAGKAAG